MTGLDPQLATAVAAIDRRLRENRRKLYKPVLPKYWAIVAHEEIQGLTPDELVDISVKHLELGYRRKKKQTLVRVTAVDKTDTVVVEVVTDDMPFLFDSLSNTLHQEGYSIRLANHPVLWALRDSRGQLVELQGSDPDTSEGLRFKAEAFIRFELEPGLNPSPANQLEALIRSVLADVYTVVDDWQAMRSKAAEIRFGLEKPHLPINENERKQACDFLEWVENNNLTFISYVRARVAKHEDGSMDLHPLPSTQLGLKIEASPWQNLLAEEHSKLILNQYLESESLLVITKANQKSPVHRNAYFDYIAIKDFDRDGSIIGEHRFLGLFTRAAYNSRATDIPLLATRIREALAWARFPEGSHNAKMLLQILETFPRDELFQSTVDELFETAMGILSLDERNRVRLFCRMDPFRRFYSLLIFIPRERYSQQLRERIQAMVTDKTGSTDIDFYIQFTESVLARLQLIVRVDHQVVDAFDPKVLEREIEQISRSWYDSFRAGVFQKYARKQAAALSHRYSSLFSTTYMAKTPPSTAIEDIADIELMKSTTDPLRIRLMPAEEPEECDFEIRAFFRNEPMALADIQPRLANFGLRLIFEDLFPIRSAEEEEIWIQHFTVKSLPLDNASPQVCAPLFEDAFVKIYTGACEDDWFNRIILAACVSWREAGILRAYSRYLKQLGIRFGQIYISEILSDHGRVARMLIELFDARFNPTIKDREARQQEIDTHIQAELDTIRSLDADRILRGLRNLILATQRTSYYLYQNQANEAIYSFKLAPRTLAEVPLPKPLYEIWVHSPTLEAVHLRGGKVARGGLRWSDRPEDFRTEVLGLMKAQMVKNAVIVPVGAKGGFICRNLPASGSREEIQAVVTDSYRTFVGAMLDLTDNLVDGKVQRPAQLVCHDDDDPYLVVAADKGTATFSDTANAISADHHFWVGDAFASGGSNGYDHKKMGITARGAWECVKRHFRELGRNIQREAFTVVGIGDMSGDVFGNGMLLSRHIRLVAAFDHRHIFIDPRPDARASWEERRRLFALPRSTWEDYDSEKLSAGGGIYPRQLKSINPGREACQALGLRYRSYTPDDLIHEILKAPVDLIWNGGIGTYVKSELESDEQVGDRANDQVRVNGNQLRCKVVGEGGNLGMTQLGRIEFSLNGGRCNTDFIDNSGGVDSSDMEVNIKIALNAALGAGTLTLKQRNKLLRDMTNEVKTRVLRNNYLQSQAISVLTVNASERLLEQAELIRILERDSGLDRKLEVLPEEKTISQRQAAGLGLTRPEVATLLSFSKIDLYNALLASSVPENTYLAHELNRYFPPQLSAGYDEYIKGHPLRREIICTRLTNSLVNRMGTAFARRLQDELGRNLGDIARAYVIAKDALQMRPLWHAIEALDNRVAASLQLSMLVETRRLVKHLTLWLLKNEDSLEDVEQLVSLLQPTAELLEKNVEHYMSTTEQEHLQQRQQEYIDQGVPTETAARASRLKALYPVADINCLASSLGIDRERVAEVYFYLADILDLTWLRRKIDALTVDSRWRALSKNAMRDDLYLGHRHLTARVLGEIDGTQETRPQIDNWVENNKARIRMLTTLTGELKTADSADFLSLSVVLRHLEKVAV